MRRRSRAMSLLELSAALVSVGLLTSILFWVLLTGQALWVGSAALVRLQQDLSLSVGPRVAREMRFTKAASITNLTADSTPALSFATAFNGGDLFVTDGRGAPEWQGQIVYYVKGGNLMRTEVTTTAASLTASQLRVVAASGTGHALGDGIDTLTLTGNCLTLWGTCPSPRGQVNRQSATFEVTPCN